MSTVYELDETDLQRLMNHAFANIVDGIRQEGLITKEQADKLALHYSVMVETEKWIPKYLSKWLGSKPNGVSFRLVKVFGREEKTE